MPKFNTNFKENEGFNEEIPESIDAERWLTDTDFIYKGNVYRLDLDFSISKIGCPWLRSK